MSNCENPSVPPGTNAGGGRESGPAPTASPEGAVLSIGNVAKMFGATVLALRYYEWRGLIARRHRVGQVRVYGWADCERLAFIIKCRQAGVPLGDLVSVIEATEEDVSASACKSGQETCMALVGRLERRRKVLDEALAELSHIYSLLSTKILNQK